MKTVSEQELKEILEKHAMWLEDPTKGKRADLSGANLSWANLSAADLSGTSFSKIGQTFLFGRRHLAFFTPDGTLRIGCYVMPITEWILGYKEIGIHEKYSNSEISAYGRFIKQCYKRFMEDT